MPYAHHYPARPEQLSLLSCFTGGLFDAPSRKEETTQCTAVRYRRLSPHEEHARRRSPYSPSKKHRNSTPARSRSTSGSHSHSPASSRASSVSPDVSTTSLIRTGSSGGGSTSSGDRGSGDRGTSGGDRGREKNRGRNSSASRGRDASPRFRPVPLRRTAPLATMVEQGGHPDGYGGHVGGNGGGGAGYSYGSAPVRSNSLSVSGGGERAGTAGGSHAGGKIAVPGLSRAAAEVRFRKDGSVYLK